MTFVYERITMNLVGAKTRREVLENRNYLVVPTVMMTPGVHEGSHGKLLYTPQQLGKFPAVWNHKPIVMSHPTLNGQGVSACDPAVLEKQKVGILLNSDYDGRLKTESWIDEEKAKSHPDGKRMLDAITRNQMVEVSTGLYHETIDTPGVWNGEEYISIVTNIMPDHLAVLVDEEGACSIKDGAGLLRNAVAGELSYDNIREQVRQILRANPDGLAHCYVCNVFPKYVIIDMDGKSMKINYTVKDSKVKISKDDPEEVMRVTSYVIANKGFLDFSQNGKNFRLPYVMDGSKISTNGEPEEIKSSTTPNQQEPAMTTPANNIIHKEGVQTLIEPALAASNATPGSPERKGLVGQLIASGSYVEQDRAFLEALPSDNFASVQNAAKKTAQGVQPQQQQQVVQQPTALTANAYIEAAPPGVREMLQAGMAQFQARKKALVSAITQNKANRFNPAWLETQDVPTLEGIVALAAPTQNQQSGQGLPALNYGGQGTVPQFLDIPIADDLAINNMEMPILPLPSTREVKAS